MSLTIQAFKTSAISQLKSVSPSANLDVEVLLEHSLNLTKSQILMQRDSIIPEEKEKWLISALEQRKTGLPIAYITGHKEFYGYDFLVTPAVLIPKPDTEILVERAIDLIIEKMEARPNSLLTICDMCTGSGCIALAVLRNLIEEYNIPEAKLPKFTLIDISSAALEIARKNLDHIFSDFPNKDFIKNQVRFVQSNLFEQVPYTFDIILTNPPYIPHSMVDQLLEDGRNEPRLALDGDITILGDRAYTIDGDEADDGLEIIRNLLPQAKRHLSPLGNMLMETGEYNAEQTATLAQQGGYKTRLLQDLEGQLRVVEMLKAAE